MRSLGIDDSGNNLVEEKVGIGGGVLLKYNIGTPVFLRNCGICTPVFLPRRSRVFFFSVSVTPDVIETPDRITAFMRQRGSRTGGCP